MIAFSNPGHRDRVRDEATSRVLAGRPLLRRHPQVTSWRKSFEAALTKETGKEPVGEKELVTAAR
jgi:hypothetical protein